MRYVYFGNFTALRPEAALWRVRTLQDIVEERFGSLPERVTLGIAQVEPNLLAALRIFLERLQIWLLVTSDEDRTTLQATATAAALRWPVQVFALSDIATALQSIG